MKVITLIGFSGSGKTTLAELIIAGLCGRGYTVGSVKRIHAEDFALDTLGTNTDRHRQAGAAPVTALGDRETDILFNRPLPIDELLAHYDQDFVVLEGLRDPRIPAIVTATCLEEIAAKDNGRVVAVAGRLADGAVPGSVIDAEPYTALPLIDGLRQPEILVDFVVRTALSL
ncbi:MAG: molybdopterin-guanine dinucleotide biosynthesis protein B [Actinomycetia bacterium]|nr:molybdopterin-guanine dinucleotide biosynthesis protein B [Actinomycetes bacterium]